MAHVCGTPWHHSDVHSYKHLLFEKPILNQFPQPSKALASLSQNFPLRVYTPSVRTPGKLALESPQIESENEGSNGKLESWVGLEIVGNRKMSPTRNDP